MPSDCDVAGVWYAVKSLLDHVTDPSREELYDELVSSNTGQDGFVRDMIPIAESWERWAAKWVNWDEFDEVWCYWVEENFGKLYFAEYEKHEGDALWRVIAEAGKFQLRTAARPEIKAHA